MKGYCINHTPRQALLTNQTPWFLKEIEKITQNFILRNNRKSKLNCKEEESNKYQSRFEQVTNKTKQQKPGGVV